MFLKHFLAATTSQHRTMRAGIIHIIFKLFVLSVWFAIAAPRASNRSQTETVWVAVAPGTLQKISVATFEASFEVQHWAAALHPVDCRWRCRFLFGISSLVYALLWGLFKSNCHPRSKPLKLLWALLKLKTYAAEKICAVLVSHDVKTLRKWAWHSMQFFKTKNSAFMRTLFTPANTFAHLLTRRKAFMVISQKLHAYLRVLCFEWYH